MIDHAYDTVLHSFSKTVQKQIMTADNLIIRCIRAEEYPFLEDFLYDAVYIPDGSALLAIADAISSRQSDGSYSGNGAEALMAVNCLDYPVQGDNSSWEEEAKAVNEASPTFGSQLLYPDAYCQGWGHTSNRKREKITASGAAPILVVGTTGDPATPYAWSESLADQLESGRLLTWEGNGHAAYTNSGHGPCVTQAVDTYLLSGTMPKKGLTCHGTE